MGRGYGHWIWGLSAALLAAGCGGGGGVSIGGSLTEEPVGFRMETADSDASSAPGFQAAAAHGEQPAPDTVATGSGTFTVDAAAVNVGSIVLPGADCGQVPDSAGEQQESGDATTDGTPGSGGPGNADGMRPTAEHGGADEAPVGTTAGNARPADACDGGNLRFEGPFRINLLTGESDPALANLQVPPGTYNMVHLMIEPVSDADDPMDGFGLMVDGSYDDGTSAVTVSAKMTNFQGLMKVQSSDGITVDEQGGVDVVVEIAQTDWFAGVGSDLDTCLDLPGAPLEDDTLTLDGSTGSACDKVNGTLRQNFVQAGNAKSHAKDGHAN